MNTELVNLSTVETSSAQIKSFVIIIGAMKSGTTSLFKYLSQHPQICAGIHKEPNFFSRPALWKQGPAYYRSLWPNFDAAVHRYALEASPQYTKMPATPHVPERIRGFDGSFRFIYILRNPIDRIESHIAHNIDKGRLGFEVSFRHRLVRRAIWTSRYGYQLDSFHAGFGDPAILLLDFDALCRRPLEVMERCRAFLELEPFAFTPLPPANVRKSRNRADEFRLEPARRAALARQLRPDILHLRDRYGFEVGDWNLL